MHAGMSDIFRERNDLDGARRHLLQSQELGEHAAMPQHPYRWRAAMARLLQAEGRAEEALTLLEEAEPLYASAFFPDVRPLAALRARMWIALGRLREARGWAREAGLSAEDDLSYLGEFAHITLARLLLAVTKTDSGTRSPWRRPGPPRSSPGGGRNGNQDRQRDRNLGPRGARRRSRR